MGNVKSKIRLEYIYKGKKNEQVPKKTRNVKIASSVKIIRANAFKNCIFLISIDIPPSVRIIEEGAFAGCISLVSIDIPSSVEAIGELAFAFCSSLTRINIPPSIKTIEKGTLTACSSLETVYLSRKCNFHQNSFPDSVKLIYAWYEVGPYILLNELIKKERATACSLNEGDAHMDLLVIQKFITISNDDIFRKVLEYLVNNEINNNNIATNDNLVMH